jgi:hypothetical protein
MKLAKKRIMYSRRRCIYKNFPEIRSQINLTNTTIEQSNAGIRSGAKKLQPLGKIAKNKRRIGGII